MFYGELLERGFDYADGHSAGSYRAIRAVRMAFESSDRKIYTKTDLLHLLDKYSQDWLDFCEAYGKAEVPIDEFLSSDCELNES